MRTLWRCVLVLAAVACLASSNASAVTHSYDDGFADSAIGISPGSVVWWAHAFTATAPGEAITSIQIAFPAISGMVNGDPFVVALYEDTDDDASPLTGLSMLASAATTVQFGGTDTFQTVDIADSAVSGGFFVAAAMFGDSGAGQYPMAIDYDSPDGQAWLAAISGTSPAELADPVSSAFIGPGPAPDYGFSGDWLLRAEGYVIPEPLTMLGVAAGVMAVGARLRRRLRAA